MSSTARLLHLHSLLQLKREWTGAALAERMDVTDRTVRRDIDKLRELGYPIQASAGTAGGYRLGAGAQLPPLLLENDEALAVALGLAAVATSPVAGVAEASVRALTKLEQVLPARLRSRFATLKAAVTRIGGPSDAVDPQHLTEISAAISANRQLVFEYERADGQRIRRTVEPYRLVDSGQRWYLVAWDTACSDWRTFRVDRIRTHPSERARFTPRHLPAADVAAYVQEAITRSPYRYDVSVRLHGPVVNFASRVRPNVAQLIPDGQHTILRAGWDDADEFLGWLFSLDVDFEILGPPEFADRCRHLSTRMHTALASPK